MIVKQLPRRVSLAVSGSSLAGELMRCFLAYRRAAETRGFSARKEGGVVLGSSGGTSPGLRVGGDELRGKVDKCSLFFLRIV